jgi:beta-lactamase class A
MKEKSGTKTITVNRALLLTLVLGAFSLGLFIGTGVLAVLAPFQANKGYDFSSRDNEGEFRFIRTSTEAKNLHANKELKPFQYKVSSLVDDDLKSGEAATISIYFRDLNNGNWFGIREHAKFSPKNLLKVPVMIAYFKWSETNPLVLRRKLRYTGKEPAVGQTEGEQRREIEPGKTYSVNDLIFRMIVHDDAAAYALLYANLPGSRLDRIFKDLSVDYNPRKRDNSLSLSAFAAFYRVLFNASYLSEDLSEKALRYLSKSTFRGAMASGIPPNIDIASKAGERTISVADDGEEKEQFQLHEFGIIYHPNRPFLLGVTVQGADTEHLEKIIRDLTRLVYEEVDRQS